MSSQLSIFNLPKWKLAWATQAANHTFDSRVEITLYLDAVALWSSETVSTVCNLFFPAAIHPCHRLVHACVIFSTLLPLSEALSALRCLGEAHPGIMLQRSRFSSVEKLEKCSHKLYKLCSIRGAIWLRLNGQRCISWSLEAWGFRYIWSLHRHK